MGRHRPSSDNPLEIRLNRVAKTIIRRAMREDLGKRGDITTRATVPTDQIGEAVIIAKSEGIIAGQKIAAEVFRSLEKTIRYDILVPDGQPVDSKTEIARLSGRLWAILAGERTALNIMGRACGIATLTGRYVQAVDGTNARITETRKTAPGLRYIDKAAVITGGGVNHRYALYDAFLLKENHIAAVGSIGAAIEACRRYSDRYGHYRVMVEARDWNEFQQALSAEPDRILLDNMTPEQIKACVDVRTGDVELEATGGITLDNVHQYAETGVDYISIGALTHSVTVMDLSLLVV
ncbi:MAG: carboxylating nicotinate-nucleotide diphosphorylase [Candidatus Electryoneaceae bacterium]|nr:carboxylating nicotinate-nucleotide diphosphorylase [Candidatus Electryoneaceae bacterium]